MHAGWQAGSVALVAMHCTCPSFPHKHLHPPTLATAGAAGAAGQRAAGRGDAAGAAGRRDSAARAARAGGRGAARARRVTDRPTDRACLLAASSSLCIHSLSSPTHLFDCTHASYPHVPLRPPLVQQPARTQMRATCKTPPVDAALRCVRGGGGACVEPALSLRCSPLPAVLPAIVSTAESSRHVWPGLGSLLPVQSDGRPRRAGGFASAAELPASGGSPSALRTPLLVQGGCGGRRLQRQERRRRQSLLILASTQPLPKMLCRSRARRPSAPARALTSPWQRATPARVRERRPACRQPLRPTAPTI